MSVTMLGFSARMAAGKTTVSTGVSEAMKAKRISFGGVVRDEASKRGIKETRETLQALGQDLVDEDVSGFCKRVLDKAGWKSGESIVVDGLRHEKVLHTIRGMVDPKYFGLLYLNIDRNTQLERWKNEDLAYSKSLDELEKHATEIEVLQVLPEHADLVLDGKRPVDNIVTDVLRWSDSKSLFGKTWEEKNARRLELAERYVRGILTADETVEFEILQPSYMQYLAVRFNPYQTQEDSHQQRLKRIEDRLKQSGETF